ncbi:MAG: hypothetical protein RL708_2592 [Bacteroidota bacterium]|jgi:hypothetical protein
MKQIILIIIIAFSFNYSRAQNLIKNSGFEDHGGGGCALGSAMAFLDTFGVVQGINCTIVDWIRISETPDGYWNKGHDFPKNYHSGYLYPHSDSVCVGGFYLFHGMGGGK